MEPISPVMPGSESIEKVLAKDQPEYIPLPVVILNTASTAMVSRWKLTIEERSKIAAGADIVVQQLTFRERLQPINMQVVHRNEMPVLIENLLPGRSTAVERVEEYIDGSWIQREGGFDGMKIGDLFRTETMIPGQVAMAISNAVWQEGPQQFYLEADFRDTLEEGLARQKEYFG